MALPPDLITRFEAAGIRAISRYLNGCFQRRRDARSPERSYLWLLAPPLPQARDAASALSAFPIQIS